MACHVLSHEMGNKCSGFTNYQSNYQKGERRITETAGRSITPVLLFPSYLKRTLAKEDSPQKVFGHYLWCLRYRSLSLLCPEAMVVMSTTLYSC